MSFRDIKGQDRALGILRQGLLKGRIFSSYLFLGPDGVGKALAAKNFAKAINCLGPKDEEAEPCDACASCRSIDSHHHPDLFVVEPKGVSSSITIGEIRELINRANFKPYEALSKVFIIESAHSMNAEASNAFLKTLEEPPKNTIFILISRSKDLLLSTIVSRSVVIRFSTAPSELVESVLIERFNAGREEAKILSNFASGRIGEAVKMKERNLIDRKNRLIDSMIKPISRRGMHIPSVWDSERVGLKENMELLVSFFRDIFLYKTLKSEDALFHVDRIDEIKNQSKQFTMEDVDYLIKRVLTLRSYIDYNVNPKIVIDVLLNEMRSYYARGGTDKIKRSR